MSAMAEPGTAQHAPGQHVVVVGADTTTVRLAEELVRSGEQLVVIAHGENPRGAIADIEALGCQMIIASQIREAELRAAGVERARAAVVLGDDDVLALRLGLMIDELAPGLRIVIEMTNPRLGGRLTSLIGDCTLLSSAELAAPAFVAAALATPDTQSFEIGGRTVAAGPRHRIGGELLAVIGDTRRTGIDAVLPQNGGDLVLGTKLIGTARNVARTSGMLGAISRIFDRRARLVMLGLAALILLSTLYFHIGGRDWLASLYLALTASTATGTGDLSTLPLGFQFGALFIQLFGLVLSAGITAVIVDALIGARLAVILGGVRGKPRHHVVVCGMGRVGTAVAVRLQSRGVPVIAIERRVDAPGVLRARQLKIPVVVAAATNASAQEIAGISRADAVLAVTDDEGSTSRSPWWPRMRIRPSAWWRGFLIMTSQAGWSGGCSSVPRAASPCWQHRRSPRSRWAGGRT